tara:strand:- start:2730 stop:3875 length:1146 start_codon:yes stop_codon:yes gene_type:complete
VNFKHILLVILSLSIPLSIAVSNVTLILLTITIVLEGDLKNKIRKICSSKWMVSIITLIMLYYLYWLIFGTYSDTLWILKRVSILWFLPVFYSTKFSYKTTQKAVFVFLISMFISSVIAISENYGFINLNGDNWTWAAFLKYTDHNVFLALSILILIYAYYKVNLSSLIKNIFVFFLFVYLFSIFSEAGKTGQIALVLLIVVYIFQELRKNIKKLILSLSLLFMSVYLIYNSSENLQKRFEKEINMVLNKESSNRLLLLQHSLEIIKQKPFVGYGAGSFSDKFGAINEETKKIVRYNHKTPHNNYLYIWVELGIFGLVALVSIFYFQIRELKTLNGGSIMVLLPIMYLLIMFTDSYFLSFNTLVLYIYLSVIIVNYQYRPS